MRVVAAQPSEYVAAAELLFRHLPASEARPRIQAALELMEAPGRSPTRLLIARQDGAIVGATLAQVLPGATGVLWPPGVSPHAQVERTADALLHEALAWLRRRGARLAQVILGRDDASLGAPLLRGGFTRPTELVFLHRVPVRMAVAGKFQTYRKAEAAEFHEVLLSSAADSRDFPEIDGKRSLREVLLGYQSAGYDPERWWLRHGPEGPAGVLILSEVEPGATWDLAYVGVVPAARGQGHGKALVAKALTEAARRRSRGAHRERGRPQPAGAEPLFRAGIRGIRPPRRVPGPVGFAKFGGELNVVRRRTPR